MMPRWIDWGPKDDLFFATTGRMRWKERGPAGTKNRTITRISGQALVTANRQVQTRHREVVREGKFCRSPRRSPGYQKSTSPTVGGGLGHEISSRTVRFSSLRFPVRTHRIG